MPLGSLPGSWSSFQPAIVARLWRSFVTTLPQAQESRMKRPPIGPRPGRHHPACGKNREDAREATQPHRCSTSVTATYRSTSAAHVCPLPTHLRTRRLLPRKQRRGEAEHRAPRVSTWAAGRRGTDRRARSRRVDQTKDKKPDRAFEAAPPSPPSPSPPASSPSDGLLRLLRPHLRHAARQTVRW